MALIAKDREPSARDLRVFGLMVLIFFGVVGGIVLWRTSSWLVTGILWGVAVVGVSFFYAVPALRRPMFVAWMRLFYPVGWLISQLMLIVVYYLVITPMGLMRRLVGGDPLGRRRRAGAQTNWVEHDPGTEPARYFRQF